MSHGTLKKKKAKRQIKGHIKWHLWCLRECSPAGSVVSFTAGGGCCRALGPFSYQLLLHMSGHAGQVQVGGTEKQQVLQEVK